MTEQEKLGWSEQDLYERVWTDPEYRKRSPGEAEVYEFIQKCPVEYDETIADVGCGTGRAIKVLQDHGFIHVCGIDFAKNCLDAGIETVFKQIDIAKDKPKEVYDWLFCSDMLEHPPPEDLPGCMSWIKGSMDKGGFFVIHLGNGQYGKGHGLHKSQYPADWWHDLFLEHFKKEYHVTRSDDTKRVRLRLEKR